MTKRLTTKKNDKKNKKQKHSNKIRATPTRPARVTVRCVGGPNQAHAEQKSNFGVSNCCAPSVGILCRSSIKIRRWIAIPFVWSPSVYTKRRFEYGLKLRTRLTQ